MSAIQKRLLAIKQKYCLTTSDLEALLGWSRSTIGAWERGVDPLWNKLALINLRLDTIEKYGGKFPVPTYVTQYERRNYLMGAINGKHAQLPRSGITTRR